MELELFYLCFSFIDSFKCFFIKEEKREKNDGLFYLFYRG